MERNDRGKHRRSLSLALRGERRQKENEGKLHFNLIGKRNSKLSQRKRSGKVPSRCNRMIEPALSQLSANGPGVLDKKEHG